MGHSKRSTSTESSRMGILRNRNYVSFLVGQNVSILGNTMYNLAILWLTQSLTHGWLHAAVWIGAVLASNAVPKVIVSPFAGVFVDRWSKRLTMMLSDIIRMFTLVLISVLVATHHAAIWELILGNFLLSTVESAFRPAFRVLQRVVVPESQLLQANSLFETLQRAMELAGPGLGGLLIGFIGMPSVFWLDTVSFAVSVMTLWFIRDAAEPKRLSSELSFSGVLRDIGAGWQYIVAVPQTRILTPFMLFYNFAVAPVESVLLVLFVTNSLHVSSNYGAAVVGLFGTALAVGELTGGLILATVTRQLPKERLFGLAMVIAAACIVSIGFLRSIPLIAGLFFIAGFCMVFVQISFFTGIQEAVPGEALGRVWALLGAAFAAVLPVSQMLFSGVATMMPVGGLISVLGGLGCAAGVGILTTPALRNIDKATSSNAESA